jgi:hypothetical protein
MYVQYMYIVLRSLLQLLVIATVVHSSPILVNVMTEAIRSSETSVLTRATRRHITVDGILHSHCRENLRSYNHNIWLTLMGTEC